MALYLVTHRTGALEAVDADEVLELGVHLVFVAYVVVFLSPREVVRRRLRRADVAAVVRL